MTYHPKIIDFFKNHHIYDEKMFKYFSDNGSMIIYSDEDWRPYIGCWSKIVNNCLVSFEVNTPYVDNECMALITIHELVHGVELYQCLGKRYHESITKEALPMLYEKLYLLENPSIELTAYLNYLDSKINSSSESSYVFGLSTRGKLLDSYNGDFKRMQRMVKKLSKKYKIN